MQYKFEKCPRCHLLGTLMSNRNNDMAQEICFDCLAKEIDLRDMHAAERFCRTYNIALVPEVWIKLAEQLKLQPAKMLETYASALFDQRSNSIDSKTGEFIDKADITFEKLNTLWADNVRQRDIMTRIDSIKESFIERARLTWGEQYSFEDLLKLEDLYYQTLRANAITNPIQRESLRTLLKVMIDINKAIATGDSDGLKTLTSAFTSMAKTAQLDALIDNTHTDDLTTLAEIVQIVEDAGYEMPYYDGADRDGIDFAIHDIEESNARLVKNATGLGPQIEQMITKYKEEAETKKTQEVEEETSISDLLEEYQQEQQVEDEPDSEITNMTFDED